MYGIDSPAAAAIRKYPGQPIWFYDRVKHAAEYYGREPTPEEANELMPSEYDRWKAEQEKQKQKKSVKSFDY
jgi:hypothetical protein